MSVKNRLILLCTVLAACSAESSFYDKILRQDIPSSINANSQEMQSFVDVPVKGRVLAFWGDIIRLQIDGKTVALTRDKNTVLIIPPGNRHSEVQAGDEVTVIIGADHRLKEIRIHGS